MFQLVWILENRVCSIYHNELRVGLARLKREVSAKRGSRAVSGYGWCRVYLRCYSKSSLLVANWARELKSRKTYFATHKSGNSHLSITTSLDFFDWNKISPVILMWLWHDVWSRVSRHDHFFLKKNWNEKEYSRRGLLIFRFTNALSITTWASTLRSKTLFLVISLFRTCECEIKTTRPIWSEWKQHAVTVTWNAR